MPFACAHDVEHVFWCDVVVFVFWFSLDVVKVFWAVCSFFVDVDDVWGGFCSVCDNVSFKVCGKDESV